MKVTDEMVNRFLSWKLPEDFHPDAGISFSPFFNVEYNAKLGIPPARHQPIGTNLLTATQAKEMLEHVLFAPPSAREASSEPDARERLRKAMLFIEEWSNWWSYALAKDDNEPLTPEEDAAASKMAESLGARARDMVIDNRRFLAAVGPTATGGEHG